MSTVPMQTVPMQTVPMSMEVPTMVDKLAKRILWRLDILSMADDDDASMRLVVRGLLADIKALKACDGVRSPNLFRLLADCIRFGEYERALAYWRSSVYGF